MTQLIRRDFFTDRNGGTRIEIFDELSDTAKAALYEFFRRTGAPHLMDEVVLPMFYDGDSQIFAAVRDRPWPPWGLGARNIVAVLQTHLVSDGCWGLSPVHVGDESLTNTGLCAALYKEALETLAVDPGAEVHYLIAEDSRLADLTLRRVGFQRTEDVFLTEAARYLTYRAPAGELLESLGLAGTDSVDVLAGAVEDDVYERNAAFHGTVYLGSRAEWTADRVSVPSEIARLVRGGHYSKPAGVPTGTGRFERDVIAEVAQGVREFLTEAEQHELLQYVLGRESEFSAATVQPRGTRSAVVDERIRSSLVLDGLGRFEALLTERIKEQLESVRSRLGHPAFPLGRIELQVTANGDRDYFGMHRDSDGGDTRELTFVYFFSAEPRRFSGGELRVFETIVEDGQVVPTDRSQTIVPRSNLAMFFPSRHDHEVLPIRVPSKAFADSRFSVTGWIHRK
ncbi:Rps23 Pro-64 3,4-dihydroxylase Tpa1-like proline 4-hydroxylase [Streptomyces achromogenes]|uniref:Rps23 Pro-64 3,4-dihydroxylase Tpa1-like proline 4-hydroxylase n=1 Tax=Streptomyces achromogenes TaxID=67255 RepID=A0ABU0QDE8_STRAH|nr:2OG-Fe(II) oxygenase [Streptomyces achromogenes]MDQ0688670.1 Rps23 Pro-64 3,4-dihydroxylase Tpa1-like proline 4-hydroxylase [Streptomyces achromogenes]